MNKLTFNQQKPTDKIWKDEAGVSIPYERTTSNERLKERKLAQMAKGAIALNKQLTEYKNAVQDIARELYEEDVRINGGKARGKGKGGITLYNFDGSIKVEVSVNSQIKFDETLIGLAKAKLDDYLNDGLSTADAVLKEMVMNAFKTTRGELDVKGIMGITKYANRIKDARFQDAVQLILKAIRRPDSKEYFKVWVKDDKGQYQDVQLNFSAI